MIHFNSRGHLKHICDKFSTLSFHFGLDMAYFKSGENKNFEIFRYFRQPLGGGGVKL